MRIVINKGIFTPALFNLLRTNSDLFPPFVQTFCAGVNTTQVTLVCSKQVNQHSNKKNILLVLAATIMQHYEQNK